VRMRGCVSGYWVFCVVRKNGFHKGVSERFAVLLSVGFDLAEILYCKFISGTVIFLSVILLFVC